MMEATGDGDAELPWDWVSKQQRIKKRVVAKGQWTECRPMEGSLCVIKISTDGCDDVVKVSWAQYEAETGQLRLVCGEAETEFERMLDRLLPTMDVSERCVVKYLTADHLEYTLTVELQQHEPNKPSYALEPDAKFARAVTCKERGTELFREGRTLDAYYRFRKAAQLLIFLDRNAGELNLATYLTVCNNLALCHLKLHNYECVLQLCAKVLEKEPNNVKCLLRRAAAFEKLRDFEKALQDYRAVINAEPNNGRALERLPVVREEVDAINERYNQTVKRMFRFS